MSDAPPCLGILGRLLGHDYEGQYNSEPSGWFDVKEGSLSYGALQALLNHNTRRTYACSVCRRCGDIKEPSHD